MDYEIEYTNIVRYFRAKGYAVIEEDEKELFEKIIRIVESHEAEIRTLRQEVETHLNEVERLRTNL
jgi:hypothetical protein